MFSLIITLIAIALVAALALATLYYGGPAFNQGQTRAKVAQIHNVFQQLAGANELYKADTGSYAQSLNDLVTANYLKSVPTAALQNGVMGTAQAADSFTFSMVAPGINAFAASMVSLDICKAVNKEAFGVDGVLAAPHALDTVTIQCYGADVDHLIVIQGKAPADLLAVSVAPSTSVPVPAVSTAPIPPASSVGTGVDGWIALPTGGTTPPTPPTPPATSALNLELTIPTILYVSPTYVSASDSVVLGTAFDYSSLSLQRASFSGAIDTLGESYWSGMAIDSLTGSIYAMASTGDLQQLNTATATWEPLSAASCDMAGVFGSKVFAVCGGVLTSFDRTTGAMDATTYTGMPTDGMFESANRNQSPDTLMNAGFGVSDISLMNVNTGAVTVKHLPVTGTTFLTKSNRIFVQDSNNDLYQIVNGAAVKVVSTESITAAGCKYYAGVIGTVFERNNGNFNFTCAYSDWEGGSTTDKVYVLKFTPAQ